MYDYRQMTPEQQRAAVEYRRLHGRPYHSPPHWKFEGRLQFIISAACYEHRPIIGESPQRLTRFENELLRTGEKFSAAIYAWVILPNHYHLLLLTEQLEELRRALGRLHGRTSFQWNGEDRQRGRKVWHNCFDRRIKSHRHFWASVNYIHHNPVKHGHAERWRDWPWSSAADFLDRVGVTTAQNIWREFPVLDYGKDWDFD